MKHSEIIDRLGGIRPLATALGHKHHTKVQKWRSRNSIPLKYIGNLLAVAKQHRIRLTAQDFIK